MLFRSGFDAVSDRITAGNSTRWLLSPIDCDPFLKLSCPQALGKPASTNVSNAMA